MLARIGYYCKIIVTVRTRWHPREVQELVPTHDLLDFRPKFRFPGGGRGEQVKTENTQSAKICLNSNFGKGGGGSLI